MKFALFAVLLISGLAWSQTAASPGHPSRHASVGKKYGHAPAAAPNSNALASQLTKIEQGTHAPASSTAPRVSTAAAVPKTAPAHSVGHSRDGEATGQVSAWSAFATWMYS